MRSVQTNSGKRVRRLGTTAVEVAVTLPVFLIFAFGLMECCHAMMVVHSLTAAARSGARYGATDGVTTTQVTTKVKAITAGAFRVVPTVLVKNGSSFDAANFDASTINYTSLPDIELGTAVDDQMFIVRVSIPYNRIAILPPFWIKNITLTGQSVSRHE